MVSRDSCRARIKIEFRIVVEVTDLRLAHLVDAVAMSYGQVSSADAVRSFENANVVTDTLELIGHSQSRNAGAEHHNLAPGKSRVLQVEHRYRTGLLHEPHGQRRIVDRR